MEDARVHYRIETWNPNRNRYETAWVGGNNFELATRMFHKPYYQRHTRRLVVITEEIMFANKGKKEWEP